MGHYRSNDLRLWCGATSNDDPGSAFTRACHRLHPGGVQAALREEIYLSTVSSRSVGAYQNGARHTPGFTPVQMWQTPHEPPRKSTHRARKSRAAMIRPRRDVFCLAMRSRTRPCWKRWRLDMNITSSRLEHNWRGRILTAFTLIGGRCRGVTSLH